MPGPASTARRTRVVAHAGELATTGDIRRGGGAKIVGFVRPASAGAAALRDHLYAAVNLS